ncbi:MAG: flagellar biosynthesis protein FlhB [Rubrivivax sp.]|nr:flagellar biosynthesis protein FlhB [Rubrivivax sp.]MBK8529108.1 flagellar biosynthesis protein FlhB [Rubrivivax sp.]
MSDAQDRTLPATPRKISKAREDGQVPRSRDLGHLAAIGVGTVLLIGLTPQLIERLRLSLRSGLRFDAQALVSNDGMLGLLLQQTTGLMLLVLPMGAATLLAALAAGLLSGGWNFTLKPLQPKFGKLNPLTGLPRMLSKTQLVETIKACTLATVLLVIGALYLRQHLDEFVHLSALPLPTALAHSGDLLRGGVVLLLLAIAATSLIDVPLQRWRVAEQLKMSHQEVKQEMKDVEGNFEMKGKIKSRMRQLARSRMLAAVPQADLVVMNPTHYAVALKYDEASMTAPKVVAKGIDLVALRIRDIAAEHKVPVLQAPPLARALYAHTEIDQEVPAALFGAVAQVLAWVYQLRSEVREKAAMPAPTPQVPPELDPHNGLVQPRAARRRSVEA